MKTVARLMALGALGALACLAFQSARAETITSKSFAYFSVGGHTAAELDEELGKRGPVMMHDGSRHPRATKIKWGGSVTYVKRGNRCAVGDVQVPEMNVIGSQLLALMALRALGQARAVVPSTTASASVEASLVICEVVSGLVKS